MTPEQRLEGIRRQAERIKTALPTLTGADFKNETTRAEITPASPVPGIPSSTTGMVKNVADSSQNLITAQTAEADRLNQLRTEYSAFGAEESLASLNDQKLRDFGVTPEAMTELKDIQLQLSDYQTDSNLRGTRIENASGQTLGQANRELTQEDRENAVRSTGLAARAAVLQGSLETGRALAQDAVNIAYKDRELKATNLINQINQMQGVVDDQTRQLLEQDKRKYEAELQSISDLKGAISEAMVSGATQAEINRLNDPLLDDASKLALAQSVTARGASEMRGLDMEGQRASIANTRDQIRSRQEADARAALESIDVNDESEQAIVAKNEAGYNIYDLVNTLSQEDGLSGAVGMSFQKLAGTFSELGVLPGTKAADYTTGVNQLKDMLALPNLEKLKGAMSDKDIAFLRNIGTRLNVSMTEDAFTKELGNVKMTMEPLAKAHITTLPIGAVFVKDGVQYQKTGDNEFEAI